MERCSSQGGFLISLFLLYMIIYCGGNSKVSGCLDWERKALTTFRKALKDPSNLLSSWDDGFDCCKWTGIACDAKTRYVVHLDCRGLGLTGSIDPSVIELKHLSYLDLSYNDFNGAPIPDFLGSMKELTYLNLSSAGFAGIIPYQLGNLSKLISLQLSSDLFYLNVENLQWLTSLPSLKYLDMSGVNLSMASDDWVNVMNKSPSLVELRLRYCLLSYIPPTLASINFTSLRVLDLHSNGFNSRIPNWISNISSFVSLDLSGNNFQGPVPDQFSQLPYLEELWLGSTNDNLGVDWSEILEGSWRKLKLLDLSFDQLHGGIPKSIGNISTLVDLTLSFNMNATGSFPGTMIKLISLESLSLYGYHTHAAIPDWLAELKNLQRVILYDCMLTGPIPAALGGLSSLQHLSLIANQLNGNIPAALGRLSSLQYLSLNGNQLNGNIPAALGGLSSLQNLSLGWNQLNGSIPAALGRLSYLQSLFLSGNQLSGNIPAALGGLSSLQYLFLSENQLNGNIPVALGGLSSLQYLSLGGNQLNGNIPAALGQLSSLQYLSLRGNLLNGTIPTSLGQLSNLSSLYLSYNSLTGNVSESLFKNLKNLKYLHLSSNYLVFDPRPDWTPPFQLEQIMLSSCDLGHQLPPWLLTQINVWELDLSNTTISGILPTSFWDLTPQLVSLNLSNNEISGQLPNPLQMLPFADIDLSSNQFSGPIPFILNGATVLDLSNNQFSGPFPPIFTSDMSINLAFISVSGNKINGTIPPSIGKMGSLVVVDFSQNNISGTIPLTLGDCVNIEALDLSKNRLSGRIPMSLGQLHQLRTMHLGNNILSGEVPSSLEKCTGLETLELGYNNFSGHIPAWIGKSSPDLKILSLRSNMFTGNIPPQLSSLTSLQVLDVAQNYLSGTIPQSLENLMAMKKEQKASRFHEVLAGSYYKENLLVSMKGLIFEYTRTVSLVTCMDLSNNNLSGEIPKGLTSLLGLRFLNLSGNNLIGKIPDKIGKLALLESLDFSKNQLSGTIPLSMSNLTFLSYLNLSNNNLSGKIPSGNQLRTLDDPSIYIGNNGLCGPPLPDKCDSDETSQSPMSIGGDVERGEEEFEMLWFSLGTALGFATGFWAFCGTLLLKKSWRIAYYHFFDKMKNRLFK